LKAFSLVVELYDLGEIEINASVAQAPGNQFQIVNEKVQVQHESTC
jgi:hypothetical protein